MRPLIGRGAESDPVNDSVLVKFGAWLGSGVLVLSVASAAVANPGGSSVAKSRAVAVCPSDDARLVTCDAYVNLRPHEASRGPVSSTPVGFGPRQFHQAYNVPATSLRHKETIAIVGAYENPGSKADLDVYNQTFGLPYFPTCSRTVTTSCYQKVTQRPAMRTNQSWIVESSLDVQTAHQMCQDCKIILVEAATSGIDDLLWANDKAASLGANIVNNSWGRAESAATKDADSHFNRPGVAFVASTGDGGYGSHYPASSPYVTAVGGTSLFLDDSNGWVAETAWSQGGSFCSGNEPKPRFQRDPGCARRAVADVAADADAEISGAAIYDSFGVNGVGGWLQMGGTSLSAPLISGILGLAGVSSGRANALPYLHGTALNLHDVRQGANGTCGTYMCIAGPGYDGPTGLGTPNGLTAFQ